MQQTQPTPKIRDAKELRNFAANVVTFRPGLRAHDILRLAIEHGMIARVPDPYRFGDANFDAIAAGIAEAPPLSAAIEDWPDGGDDGINPDYLLNPAYLPGFFAFTALIARGATALALVFPDATNAEILDWWNRLITFAIRDSKSEKKSPENIAKLRRTAYLAAKSIGLAEEGPLRIDGFTDERQFKTPEPARTPEEAKPYEPGSHEAKVVMRKVMEEIVDDPEASIDAIIERLSARHREYIATSGTRVACQCPDCKGKTFAESTTYFLARMAATVRDMEPEIKVIRFIEKARQRSERTGSHTFGL